MRFDPVSKRLSTDDGRFIKELHCPLQKRWDEMEPVGDGDRVRTCGSCRKNVHNLEGMSDYEVLRRFRGEREECVMLRLDSPNLTIEGQSVAAMAALDESCPLRRIRTARGLREIEELRSPALRPLVVPVGNGRRDTFAVWQNVETGEVIIQGDARFRPDREDTGNDGRPKPGKRRTWVQVIGWRAYELGPRRGDDDYPIAAYMIPSDLRPGERVFVEDIIEDVLASENRSQGACDYHRSATALWTGRGFRFQVPEPSYCIG